MAVADVVYEKIMMNLHFNRQLIQHIRQPEKCQIIHRKSMEIIQIADNIPEHILTVCAEKNRSRWKLKINNSKKAVGTQNRFIILKNQIKQQFATLNS